MTEYNQDLINFYTDRHLKDVSNKYELYRGLIDTPCNLIYQKLKQCYLLLSSTALDDQEHEVIISSDNWGLKSNFPIDKIERAIKNHQIKLNNDSVDV